MRQRRFLDLCLCSLENTIINIAGSSVRVTDEAKAKRKTGLKIREQDETVKLLDDLITKKGEESY